MRTKEWKSSSDRSTYLEASKFAMGRIFHVAKLFALAAAYLVASAHGEGGQQTSARKKSAREIHAQRWYNPQPVRLYAPGSLRLLHFWSVDSPQSRALVGTLNELQDTFRERGLVIVGLTDSDPEAVERFIRVEGVRYKVGAGSRSAKLYQVRDLPAAVLIDWGDAEENLIRRWYADGESLTKQSLRDAVEEAFAARKDRAAAPSSRPPRVGARAPQVWDPAPEISAKWWFNAQPVRVYTPPEGILLGFWSARWPQSERFVKTLNKLYQTHRDGRLLIVALTEDDAVSAQEMIRSWDIRFKVGAESSAGGAYGVKGAPVAMMIHPRERQIRWVGYGDQLDEAALSSLMENWFMGPDKSWRSAERWTQERVDWTLLEAHADEGLQIVEAIVADILAGKPEHELLEPEDLAPLDAFYEAGLPSDPALPEAPSDELVRCEYVVGWHHGEPGAYATLYGSGRLSEAARIAVRNRLVSVVKNDKSCRLGALASLGKGVGHPGDEWLRSELTALRDQTNDPFARGSIQRALDRLDPAIPPAVTDPPDALDLLRKINNLDDPGSSPWAEGHAYKLSAPDTPTQQLIENYWASLGGDTEIERENRLLKRWGVAGEMEHRALGDRRGADPPQARVLVDMLHREPERRIRLPLVGALYELGKKGTPEDRNSTIESLEQWLSVEPDRYWLRAKIEYTIKELRAKP